jgi:hypothetical protein
MFVYESKWEILMSSDVCHVVSTGNRRFTLKNYL